MGDVALLQFAAAAEFIKDPMKLNAYIRQGFQATVSVGCGDVPSDVAVGMHSA
jgi:hypothetical protein